MMRAAALIENIKAPSETRQNKSLTRELASVCEEISIQQSHASPGIMHDPFLPSSKAATPRALDGVIESRRWEFPHSSEDAALRAHQQCDPPLLSPAA